MDYVGLPGYGDSSDENPFYTVNVVANKTAVAGAKTIDATEITPAVLESRSVSWLVHCLGFAQSSAQLPVMRGKGSGLSLGIVSAEGIDDIA